MFVPFSFFNQPYIVLTKAAVFVLLLNGFLVTLYAQNKGLKEFSDFPIGNSLALHKLKRDRKMREIILQEFNSITSGNDMKMYRMLNSDGSFYWKRADALVAFAEKHQLRLFGHTLIWHSGTPQWVHKKVKDNPMWLASFLENYITNYVTRYKGKVAGWDVVNEAMNTQGGELRETIWYDTLGEDYIAMAFHAAHKADPEADLFINDFNTERDTLKLNGLLDLVKRLQEKQVPISGIGFQMHLRMDIPDSLIIKTLKKAAATGLKIHLSEVDLIFNKHNDEKFGGIQLYDQLTPQMKKDQADKYQRLVDIYQAVVPKAQQYGITFWGFNDRDTWIRPFFKLLDWPTIFDEALEPKPAYYGFKKGLMN